MDFGFCLLFTDASCILPTANIKDILLDTSRITAINRSILKGEQLFVLTMYYLSWHGASRRSRTRSPDLSGHFLADTESREQYLSPKLFSFLRGPRQKDRSSEDNKRIAAMRAHSIVRSSSSQIRAFSGLTRSAPIRLPHTQNQNVLRCASPAALRSPSAGACRSRSPLLSLSRQWQQRRSASSAAAVYEYPIFF
jgi:hypothetical protein